MSTILLAILVGAAFGFALDRVGATNPGYIIRMLNLTDLHLMKTIFTGIGVASVLLFGGLLLGIGFAVAGYCPGTGLTAMATGRIDAVFFVLGGLIGAGAYMLAFGGLAGSALLEPIAGGKATLAPLAGTDYPSLLSSISGEWLGLAIGVAFVVFAWMLPKRAGAGRTMSAAAE